MNVLIKTRRRLATGKTSVRKNLFLKKILTWKNFNNIIYFLYYYYYFQLWGFDAKQSKVYSLITLLLDLRSRANSMWNLIIKEKKYVVCKKYPKICNRCFWTRTVKICWKKLKYSVNNHKAKLFYAWLKEGWPAKDTSLLWVTSMEQLHQRLMGTSTFMRKSNRSIFN